MNRHAMVVIAATESFFVGGLVFGWPPMLLLLESEGEFSSLCNDKQALCSSRLQRLNNIFVAGSTAFAFSNWPSGILLDRCGPRFSSCMGLLLCCAGALLFGYSSSSGFDAFVPGFILMGIGGPQVVFSQIHLQALYPLRGGTVVAILSVMIDASALNFEIALTLYNYAGVSRKGFFIFIAAFCLFAVVLNLCVVPKKSYSVAVDSSLINENNGAEVPQLKSTSSFVECLKSPLYWGIVLFTSVLLFCNNFYLGTYVIQLTCTAKV
jgi:MFS family permease